MPATAASASLPLAVPPLAVTMGDPAGIGLEITLQAWRQRHERGQVYEKLVAGKPGHQ